MPMHSNKVGVAWRLLSSPPLKSLVACSGFMPRCATAAVCHCFGPLQGGKNRRETAQCQTRQAAEETRHSVSQSATVQKQYVCKATARVLHCCSRPAQSQLQDNAVQDDTVQGGVAEAEGRGWLCWHATSRERESCGPSSVHAPASNPQQAHTVNMLQAAWRAADCTSVCATLQVTDTCVGVWNAPGLEAGQRQAPCADGVSQRAPCLARCTRETSQGVPTAAQHTNTPGAPGRVHQVPVLLPPPRLWHVSHETCEPPLSPHRACM